MLDTNDGFCVKFTVSVRYLQKLFEGSRLCTLHLEENQLRSCVCKHRKWHVALMGECDKLNVKQSCMVP